MPEAFVHRAAAPPVVFIFSAFRLPLNLAATARSKVREIGFGSCLGHYCFIEEDESAVRDASVLGTLGFVAPRASRTHTGYRLFAAEALQYVEFVRKSKKMGLSLRQMHRVLEAARSGQSPCPEVERWTRARLSKIEEQIRELQALQRRLRILSRDFGDIPRDRDRSGELCSLIVGLPEEKKFRKQKDGESACSDNRCEGLQTKNGQPKKTSR